MADFIPINTQEEFDERLKDRLARERATITKQFEEKYADYDQIKKDRDAFSGQIEGFQKTAKENADKITGLETQLAEANKKASGLELENLRTQVALDKGLPIVLRGRLNGTTKEELEKDAESLKEIFSKENRKDLPGFEPYDSSPQSDKAKKEADLKNMVNKLRKGE